MRYLILTVFGFTTLSTGLCPMANAQMAMEPRREMAMMCHSSPRHHGSITACSTNTKAAMSLTQDPCPNGSCIIRGTTGERILSSEKAMQIVAAQLPATFSQPQPDLDQGPATIDSAFGPAPPGLERSEVLRS